MKSSNIIFHENPCGGIRVVLCGRTDGQTRRCKQSLYAIAIAPQKNRLHHGRFLTDNTDDDRSITKTDAPHFRLRQ